MSDVVTELNSLLRKCTLCPRECGVDRTAGKVGACGIGVEPRIAASTAHHGEEQVISGRGGSGAIFFGGCNMVCVFCQNYEISRRHIGKKVTPRELAAMMLRLEREHCENINFVTPTHVAHAVAEAIIIARAEGLSIPTLYNSGGYDSVKTLRLLDGLIDIYMPDFKYSTKEAGKKYSGVENYPDIAAQALAEMYRQAGPLRLNKDGVAVQGVLVRHLVLPRDVARSRDAIDIIAKNAPGCAINIMDQYRPEYRATEFPELTGRISKYAIETLRRHARSRGLLNQ